MNRITAMAIVLMLAGCTDSKRASFGALGDEATVTCYSGGTEIYKGRSTGKVLVAESGFSFRSKKTNSYVRTNADCIITTDG